MQIIRDNDFSREAVRRFTGGSLGALPHCFDAMDPTSCPRSGTPQTASGEMEG